MSIGRAPRVAIVSGVRVPHDAISNVIAQQYRVLESSGYECQVFVHHSGCDDGIDETTVVNSWALSNDEWYRSADLVIFHFGIHYDLFNALILDHQRARRVVHFHNVTPPELLTGLTHRAAFEGLYQISIASYADVIWSDSPHNTESLARYCDIDPDQVVLMELCVPDMDEVLEAAARAHPHDPVLVLGVGRFVRAKGQMDLVEAIALLDPQQRASIRCVLAGSYANSGSDFIEELAVRIDVLGLEKVVELQFDRDDREVAELFAEADVFVTPSHHEGFCVPVIEALATGCRVIATDAGALVDTLDGHGSVYPAGDVGMLSALLSTQTGAALDARERGSSAHELDVERRRVARGFVEHFAPEAFARRTIRATTLALAHRVA